jgi:hypothetical protein
MSRYKAKQLAKEAALTADELRRRLSYDQETGIFRWLLPNSNRLKAGDIAGSISYGYLTIRINGLLYRCHRLAWLYVYGVWPSGQLDHKNLNRSDNRINNLRVATNAQNIINSPARNQSGLKGVWKLKDGRFKTMCAGKHLGSFRTAEEASAAYLAYTQNRYGKEFARTC